MRFFDAPACSLLRNVAVLNPYRHACTALPVRQLVEALEASLRLVVLEVGLAERNVLAVELLQLDGVRGERDKELSSVVISDICRVREGEMRRTWEVLAVRL